MLGICICVLAVRGMRQQGARSKKPTIQQKDELGSGRRAERVYFATELFWTSTDVLQDAQVMLETGSTQECRARIEQGMVDRGDAIYYETSGNQEEIVQGLDVSLKKRKIGEPDITASGASSLTVDPPKREESEQGSGAGNENYRRCALRRSTNFFVARHLSTSAEIELH